MGPFLTQLRCKIELYNFHLWNLITICSQIFLPNEVDKLLIMFAMRRVICIWLKVCRNVSRVFLGWFVTSWITQKSRKVVECVQGKNEMVVDYVQHFAQRFMLYVGYSMINNVIATLNSTVPVSQWTNGLRSELCKVLPILKAERVESKTGWAF